MNTVPVLDDIAEPVYYLTNTHEFDASTMPSVSF